MVQTGSVVLAAAVAQLRASGVDDPARDARLLLAHALGIPASRLTLVLPDPLGDGAAAAFEALVARRANREPLSHLTGSRLFWGRAFHVTPDVLDPRPETECLIAEALGAPYARVLDLGTGSGCILLTLLAERPGATGTGTDLSPAALAVAERNRDALGLGDRAVLRAGSWFDAVEADETYDLIVSNPPYIAASELVALPPEVRAHEPAMALSDGGDGLSAYRAIATGAPARLRPGGRLLLEIGAGQGAAVARIVVDAGLSGVRVLPDLDGRDRVVAAVRAGPPDRETGGNG